VPFQKGQSGNPAGSSKRVRERARTSQETPADPGPSTPHPTDPPLRGPGPPPDPQSLLERAVAKLAAIMDDPEAETGHQLMAIRLLINEDLASTIRAMERDHGEEESRRATVERGMRLVLEHHPEINPDQAEAYIRTVLREMEPRTLGEVLKDKLGFWSADPPQADMLTRIWHELGLPGEPDRPPQTPSDEPTAPPAVSPAPEPDRPVAQELDRLPCGLVELTIPEKPDDSGMAGRHVDRPDPALPVAPLSKPTPIMSPEREAAGTAERDRIERERQAQERRIVWFGDLAIDPFSQGM
jgi:hypothetical protein